MVSDLKSVLFGFSRAMYSTWFFYKPDCLLLDAGEGVATHLGNRVFGVERILLSHGHIDHVSGLPVFLHARDAAMGDVEKALEIYFPLGESSVEAMRQYLKGMTSRLSYDLRWFPLEAGDSFPVALPSGHRRIVQSFPTRHAQGRPSLGYNVIEIRRRLREGFRDLSQNEVRDRVKEGGRDALTEEYEQTLVSYCGDGVPVDPGLVPETDLLMHEATLLEPEDLKYPVHSTMEGAMRAALEARARCLLLFHISSRYRSREIEQKAESLAEKLGLPCPLWIQHFNRLWQVGCPESRTAENDL